MSAEGVVPLASVAVWANLDALPASGARRLATLVEELGYASLWVPETTGRDPFALLADLGRSTTELGLATGIANVYSRHPRVSQQAALTLAELTGDRFVCGLGVSHARTVEGLRGLDHSRPLPHMRAYVQDTDAAPYAGPVGARLPARVLAALGPRMLALAGEISAGAHTYSVTPEHTRKARAVLGPDRLLCVEQKVVLCSDAERAREAGRSALARIRRLPSYTACWRRLGFRDEEIERLAPRFVDGLVAWGDEEALRARVT